MERRELPERRARVQALRIINLDANPLDEDIDNELNANVEEDDAVIDYIIDADDTIVDPDVDIDNDDLVDEEMGFHSDFDENDVPDDDSNTFTAPSTREWSTTRSIDRGRPLQRNIFDTANQGFRRGLRPDSRAEAFMIIFHDIIDLVVINTNRHGRRTFRDKWKYTTKEEILAYIGLHSLAGVFKAHHRCARELWSSRDGHAAFSATMSFNRFSQLRSSLRFDDPLRRNTTDKLAPIRDVVNLFNSELRSLYQPGPFLVVDEMLIEFHGRVGFTQYIPTKPGKFGIKVYWIVDNSNTMPLRCLVYTGRSTLPENAIDEFGSNACAYVMTLANDYLNKGRNITVDNFFTSDSLCMQLRRKNTTLIGTVRNNRREVPSDAKSIVHRTRNDSKHYYSGEITLCSFWDKGRKPVLLFSTMHGRQENIVEGKPEIVQAYNQTKSGVDNLDKLVRGYSSKRKSRRWPCSVFFVLVDTAIIAAHKLCLDRCENFKEDHYTFKKEMAYELCKPIAMKRLQMRSLRVRVKDCILSSYPELRISNVAATVSEVTAIQGRCSFCVRSKDRKIRKKCGKCGRFVCQSHQLLTCPDCQL